MRRRLVKRRDIGARRHHTVVLSRLFALFDPVTLTFDLILIGGRGITVDYLCAKFGNFSFSRFGFIVRTESQNHRGG